MKRTVDYYDFRQAFADYDRIANFTPEGLEMLFNWLEELEQDTGEEMELDVIAICCEFSEDDWEDIADNYSVDLSEYTDDIDKSDAVLEYLNENTLVVGNTEATIVYAVF